MLLAFGRDLKPRRRTDQDKREVGPIINVNGQRNDEEWDICDHDPSIARIMVDPDDGSVWVLTPSGANEQPEGILQTWDVFSPDGEFLRQVAVPLGHEIREGSCFLVGEGHFIVIRGTGTPFAADPDEADAVVEEAEPLELICYRLRMT